MLAQEKRPKRYKLERNELSYPCLKTESFSIHGNQLMLDPLCICNEACTGTMEKTGIESQMPTEASCHFGNEQPLLYWQTSRKLLSFALCCPPGFSSRSSLTRVLWPKCSLWGCKLGVTECYLKGSLTDDRASTSSFLTCLGTSFMLEELVSPIIFQR